MGQGIQGRMASGRGRRPWGGGGLGRGAGSLVEKFLAEAGVFSALPDWEADQKGENDGIGVSRLLIPLPSNASLGYIPSGNWASPVLGLGPWERRRELFGSFYAPAWGVRSRDRHHLALGPASPAGIASAWRRNPGSVYPLVRSFGPTAAVIPPGLRQPSSSGAWVCRGYSGSLRALPFFLLLHALRVG